MKKFIVLYVAIFALSSFINELSTFIERDVGLNNNIYAGGFQLDPVDPPDEPDEPSNEDTGNDNTNNDNTNNDNTNGEDSGNEDTDNTDSGDSDNTNPDNEDTTTPVTEDKEGYQTKYIIIPDDINITEEDEFNIVSMNDDDSYYIESVLAENANDEGNQILLEDDIDSNIADGYKLIKAQFPADDNEDVKFALGYKLNENDGVHNYVYLLNDDPSEEDILEYVENNHLGLIDPENYSYEYDDFPGIEASSKSRYLAVPVMEGSLNFETRVSNQEELTFTIKDDGTIVAGEEFYLKATVLAAEYNSSSPVFTAKLMVKEGSQWNMVYHWDDDLQNTSNRTTYDSEALTPKVTYPAQTEIGVEALINSSSRKSWDADDVASGPNDENYYMEVHRNGSEIYNILKPGVDDQVAIEDLLKDYIKTEDGKAYADIGPYDIIILTEHATNNVDSSAFDLQDTVVLITLKSAASTSITTYNYTIVKDEGTRSTFDIDMESGTNNSNKQRISDIEMKIINGSEKNFEVKSIEE